MALLPPIVVSYKLDLSPRCKSPEIQAHPFQNHHLSTLFIKHHRYPQEQNRPFLFQDSFAALVLELASSNLLAYLP